MSCFCCRKVTKHIPSPIQPSLSLEGPITTAAEEPEFDPKQNLSRWMDLWRSHNRFLFTEENKTEDDWRYEIVLYRISDIFDSSRSQISTAELVKMQHVSTPVIVLVFVINWASDFCVRGLGWKWFAVTLGCQVITHLPAPQSHSISFSHFHCCKPILPCRGAAFHFLLHQWEPDSRLIRLIKLVKVTLCKVVLCFLFFFIWFCFPFVLSLSGTRP